MREYIIKRLLQMIPTILVITLVVFAMMKAIPGDPIITLLGDAYDEADAEALRKAYGFDKPIIVQYFIWLGKLLRGDWGVSILSSREVLNDVLIRLPITIELVILAMIVALVIAVPAGIIAAVRQNTWGDYTAMSTAMVGISVPDFFLGVLLLLFFFDFDERAFAQFGLGVLAGNVPEHGV
jgi:peptide/nickel transport system permease protein